MSSPERTCRTTRRTSSTILGWCRSSCLRFPPTRAEISPRLGILVEQRTPLSQLDEPSATSLLRPQRHPRLDPGASLRQSRCNRCFRRGTAWPERLAAHLRSPGRKRNHMQEYPWVDPDTSLQWAAFQRMVRILQQRGNRVFVLVGPFNEHMLTPASLQRYRQVKAAIAAWLQEKQSPPLRSAAAAQRAVWRRQPSTGRRLRPARRSAHKNPVLPVLGPRRGQYRTESPNNRGTAHAMLTPP